MSKVKILFLASNPGNTQPLKLDDEIRSITEKIRLAEYRDELELVSMWAVRPDDMLQGLNQHKPTIVHFSGHGSDVGEIILMDNNGHSKPVSAASLKMLFKTLKDNIRLVVLNACFSKIQAQAISEVIDCVIGMNTSIGDDAAIKFAASFYRALGFCRSVQDAFDQGITALMLQGIPEENTPELIVRQGIDPNLIIIASTQEIDQGELLTKLIDHFDMKELRQICFNLGVKPGLIADEDAIDSFALNIIVYFKNRGVLDSLVAECRKQRPDKF